MTADYRYVYNPNGQLARQYAVENGVEKESYVFEYDSLGRLIRSREEGANHLVQRTEHLYDQANRLTNQNWVVGQRSFKESYTYNSSDGTMASMQIVYDDANGWNAKDKLTYTYDSLKRLTQVLDTENGSTQFYTRNYVYRDISSDKTTSQLAQFTYRNPSSGNSVIYGNAYTYDANGNITQVDEVFTVNGVDQTRTLATYVYDELNQLTQETRNTYSGTSTTPTTVTVVSYTVDYAGNLRTVETAVNNVDAGTVSYTYGDSRWADLLTAYDGHAIAYEGQTINPATGTVTGTVATGNPINWYNGTSYTGLNWTQGRRLESITKGSDTYSYEYDMSGIRCVKIADGLRHEYVTQNGKVVRETVRNASTDAFQYMLDFTYDESGHPLTMRRYYNEAQTSYNTYHYVLNAQGDVIKLLHGANTTVAEYSYDAWGRILTAAGSLADLNPLRYRGYYYDTETGFYYLQSRYYDPIVKRFLNSDAYGSTGKGFLGYNMFAYCNNNSVNHTDSIGYDYVESIDTDGDGIPDCDVYSYSYECNIVIQISYNYSFSVSGEGKIYFLRNVHDPKQLDDPSNWPNGYDPSSDYLCIDSLNYKQNPNIHLHNSYMCSIEAKMLAITTEIEAYGKLQQNPELGWGREAREMVDEWKYHNWLAASDEAKHVDFDRYEKNKNFIYYLNKGFKRVQWKVTYGLLRLLFE